MPSPTNEKEKDRRLILLTGATGYIGGRLLSELEPRGYRIRCMARRPQALASSVVPSTEIVAGDVLDRGSLEAALRDVSVAYYLIHSMESTGSFEEDDRIAARNFGEAARAAGVERIIYLGGLGEEEHDLSPHLRSRQEVGHVLRASGVPVLELRASIVLGSGSTSFEMIRSLVEKLPILITPRWVSVCSQPIATEDVIAYLMAALHVPVSACRIYEIGGADQVSYAGVMRAYARQRKLRRWMLPVPVLTPYLSSLWLGLVTPLYARVGRALIEGIVHPTVVLDESAREVFDIEPMGVDAAVGHALAYEDKRCADTRWSDAISSGSARRSWFGWRLGSRMAASRMVTVASPPRLAFEPIRRIGGKQGWYALNWLLRLRGLLDRLVGGVGMRAGREDPDRLRVGDAVDSWRVEAHEPEQYLRLVSELTLPGRAWLDFEVSGEGTSSRIRLTESFDPLGVSGRAYWFGLHPLRVVVLTAMLRGIARQALRSSPRQGDTR
jgi:uncharacterized protein YbjT (DUF2867 family)